MKKNAVQYKESQNQLLSRFYNSVECAINLGYIQKGYFLPCGHTFSQKVIKDWLIKSNSCPICFRKDVTLQKIQSDFKINQFVQIHKGLIALKKKKDVQQKKTNAQLMKLKAQILEKDQILKDLQNQKKKIEQKFKQEALKRSKFEMIKNNQFEQYKIILQQAKKQEIQNQRRKFQQTKRSQLQAYQVKSQKSYKSYIQAYKLEFQGAKRQYMSTHQVKLDQVLIQKQSIESKLIFVQNKNKQIEAQVKRLKLQVKKMQKILTETNQQLKFRQNKIQEIQQLHAKLQEASKQESEKNNLKIKQLQNKQSHGHGLRNKAIGSGFLLAFGIIIGKTFKKSI